MRPLVTVLFATAGLVASASNLESQNVIDFGGFPKVDPLYVALPSDLSQQDQFKIVVRYNWKIRGEGVTAVDLMVRDPNGVSQLVKHSAELQGTQEYITQKGGRHEFLLIGYDAAGEPRHFEIDSIDVPEMPADSNTNEATRLSEFFSVPKDE
jgi:hypothetical protein